MASWLLSTAGTTVWLVVAVLVAACGWIAVASGGRDTVIFGPPSIDNPILFDRTGKHKLLLALGQCHSLDQCSSLIRLILRPATASLLTPHNYTFILLTLHSHARPLLQHTAYHSAAQVTSTSPTAGLLSSLVCDVGGGVICVQLAAQHTDRTRAPFICSLHWTMPAACNY